MKSDQQSAKEAVLGAPLTALLKILLIQSHVQSVSGAHPFVPCDVS
jgi:hypothetical protein